MSSRPSAHLKKAERFIVSELTARRIPTATDINKYMYPYSWKALGRPNSIDGRLSQLRIQIFKGFGLVKVGADGRYGDQFSGRWRWPDGV